METNKSANASLNNINEQPIRHISDIVTADKILQIEILKIENIFEKMKIVYLLTNKYSIEEYINKNGFLLWKARGTYLSIDELKNNLGFTDTITHIQFNKLKFNTAKCYLYLEYVINMLNLFDKIYADEHKRNEFCFFSYDSLQYNALIQNIKQILDKLDKQYVEVSDELFIIVDKNPNALDAIKHIEKEDVKIAVQKYNHFNIKNDISKKRQLLQIMANDFEPRRIELENTKEWRLIASDLGFLFNNLNIRHNNIDGIKANPHIKKMDDSELLKWYDTTYSLYLSAVNADTYNNSLKADITKLKSEVNNK